MSQGKQELGEIPEEHKQELREIITGQDLTFEEAKELYREKFKEAVDDVNSEYFTKEEAVQTAKDCIVEMVKSELVKDSREGGNRGEAEPVEMITIGHSGVTGWGDDNDDVLYGYAVVSPEGREKQTATVLVHEGKGGDVDRAKEQFFSEPATHCKGWFDVTEHDRLDDHYMLRTTEESKITEYEYGDDDPIPKPQLVKAIQQQVEPVDVENVHNHVTQKNAEEYPVAFRGDLRRLRVTVVDAVMTEDSNIYTVMDETTPTPETLPERVQGDQGRSPGLTCFVEDDFFKYGSESVVEIIGIVKVNNDGEILVSVHSVIPVVPQEMDAADYTEDDDTDDTRSSQEIL